MKKFLKAALIPAFLVGTTATTFAAANPFSDVPAGHWAYNSVVKLASEGVIEGYGDGTFLGNRNITRYEMAQMIAKALAKNPQGANKAELDKLAAEFRAELDNLGVRIAELEKHSDMVQWTGEVRYRYWNDNENTSDSGKTKRTRSRAEIRIFPTAEINDHWTAKARFTANNDMREDATTEAAMTYMFAEGSYDRFNIQLGKMPLFTNADGGIVADDFFSGIRLSYGDKFKFTAEGGRWKTLGTATSTGRWSSGTKAADYWGVEGLYNDGNRFNFGLAYRYFKSDGLTSTNDKNTDKANVFSVGAGYKFGGDVKLSGAYAQNSKADRYKRGYNIELAYQGANRKQKGTWGAFAAYRYVGQNVGFAPTFDPFSLRSNKKGVEGGLTWAPFQNTWAKVSYFHGKTLDTRETDKTFFGRFSWYF